MFNISKTVLYLLISCICFLSPAHAYSEEEKPHEKMRVAIVEFDVKGDLGIKDAGAIIAEWMINAVNRTGKFDLKERVLLKKVLKEQEIGMTGMIKAETASKIGEIYGVRGLITGSVFKWGNVISVTARLIDTQNGSIMKTSGVKTKDIDSIPNRIDELAQHIAGTYPDRNQITPAKETAAVKEEEKEKTKERMREAGENMVFVKGGCFNQVCSNWSIFCDPDYESKRKVCVEDFYIDKYETTQKDYETATGENPSYFKGDDNPVERVTWPDAKKYCERNGKRLPTEAEWAYAASNGGANFSWSEIESRSTFEKYAWYNKNSKNKSHEAGHSVPDSLGIYDIESNVWEWVGEWQDSTFIDKIKYNSNALGQGRYLFDLRIIDLPRSCDPSRRFARHCNTELYRRSLVMGFRCAR